VQEVPLNEFSRDKIDKSVPALKEEKIARKRSAVAAVYDRRRRWQSAATGASDLALRFLSLPLAPAWTCVDMPSISLALAAEVGYPRKRMPLRGDARMVSPTRSEA
jgi:hypothetical protein